MDEYIKREDALNALLYEMVGTGYQSRAMLAIDTIPIANVAPRAEVAREIFAEIDKIIADIQSDNYLRNLGIGFISNDEKTTEQKLAELRKKYESEGSDDVKV